MFPQRSDCCSPRSLAASASECRTVSSIRSPSRVSRSKRSPSSFRERPREGRRVFLFIAAPVLPFFQPIEHAPTCASVARNNCDNLSLRDGGHTPLCSSNPSLLRSISRCRRKSCSQEYCDPSQPRSARKLGLGRFGSLGGAVHVRCLYGQAARGRCPEGARRRPIQPAERKPNAPPDPARYQNRDPIRDGSPSAGCSSATSRARSRCWRSSAARSLRGFAR